VLQIFNTKRLQFQFNLLKP